MTSIEQQLRYKIVNDHEDEAVAILRAHPSLDVNWKDQNDWTVLQLASYYGHAKVVKLLLVHPAIDCNVRAPGGFTPLLLACWNDYVSVVYLLLKNPRVNTTLADHGGHTPLWWASSNGNLEVIELMIASGQDLGDLNQKGSYGNNEDYTALEVARKNNNIEIESLLVKFMANPELIRHQVQVKLGLSDAIAAEIFALTIFLCDGLLKLNTTPITSAAVVNATPFFEITSKLPMEVQMIMCSRAVGSMKQNILRKDSEPAFKSLARTLLLPKAQ
jgi:hypothetical protein